MPKCLDPDSTFTVWLDSDAGKPIESRPVFEVKYQTGRQTIRLMDLYDNMGERSSGAELMREVFASIASTLVGWRNMGRDFDPDALPDLLSYVEVMELFGKIIGGIEPDGESLGKSDSPH